MVNSAISLIIPITKNIKTSKFVYIMSIRY
jgi:hypothetical protein